MNLSPAQQRVLDSFLSGRLPAGQLHAQLRRASGVSAAPPPSARRHGIDSGAGRARGLISARAYA